MPNGIITPTTFQDLSKYVKKFSFDEINIALNRLDSLKTNVTNCNCVPVDCCQTCQACQSCQVPSCQSLSCQSRSCQSLTCQSYSCQRNCGPNCTTNCNCSGNNGT